MILPWAQNPAKLVDHYKIFFFLHQEKIDEWEHTH